ncbi:MAG: DoxX family protein [Xanthomonadales bacterium]|nr:DoxX family protein [Xanthomonadales bacterium]
MKDLLKPEIGIFTLRVSFGIVLLAHSLYLKMMVFGLAGTAGYFGSIGLPGFLAYVVFGIETVAGIALILGYKTRFFAGLTIPVLLGATWAHAANGWLFSNANGGWEYPLLLTILAFVLMTLGNGKFAISKNF